MLQSFTIVEIILTLFAKFGRLRQMKSKPYQRKTFEVFLYHCFSNGVGYIVSSIHVDCDFSTA